LWGRATSISFCVSLGSLFVEGCVITNRGKIAASLFTFEPLFIAFCALRTANKRRKGRSNFAVFWPEYLSIISMFCFAMYQFIDTSISVAATPGGVSIQAPMVLGLVVPLVFFMLIYVVQFVYYISLPITPSTYRLFHGSQMMSALCFAVMAIIFSMLLNFISILAATIFGSVWILATLTVVAVWFTYQTRVSLQKLSNLRKKRVNSTEFESLLNTVKL
jgi:sterol desaturase/sphingolipid hydroxylase (fatty acid hydroxylase superfamily)